MIICPDCQSENIKLNGHIYNGKQNHRCKACGRQFVLNPANNLVSDATKSLIDKLLLEKITLAGISRATGVSEQWLQHYISDLYAACPDDLCAQVPDQTAMSQYLEDKFDKFIYTMDPLKKTLYRLSMSQHGRILRHLKQI